LLAATFVLTSGGGTGEIPDFEQPASARQPATITKR